MKEFSAQTGGRYTYADDLENLQDLALAFAQIFDDCDNFIVSGCEITGNAISAGYVFLNGNSVISQMLRESRHGLSTSMKQIPPRICLMKVAVQRLVVTFMDVP